MFQVTWRRHNIRHQLNPCPQLGIIKTLEKDHARIQLISLEVKTKEVEEVEEVEVSRDETSTR